MKLLVLIALIAAAQTAHAQSADTTRPEYGAVTSQTGMPLK